MTSSTMITISVPLTRADRQQAQTFKDLQSNPAKADQVYENTLAVLATHRYLTMIDIPTDLENSHSQKPDSLLSANVADLYVPEARGRLECRAVRAGDNTCFIPEEVWRGGNRGDRIGYVVVQLNETNTEATVLGFVPEVSVERLPLERLQSLDDLIVAIGDYAQTSNSESEPEVTTFVVLKDWLDGIFNRLWLPPIVLPKSGIAFASIYDGTINEQEIQQLSKQEIQQQVEQLVVSCPDRAVVESVALPASEPQMVLAYLIESVQDDEARFKAAELLWKIDPHHPAVKLSRAKDLGLYLAGHSVALLVVLLPRPDGRVAVLARVYAIGNQLFLPVGLKLVVLDENGDSFSEVTARHQNDYIQFKFSAALDDRFSIRIAIDDVSVTENVIL